MNRHGHSTDRVREGGEFDAGAWSGRTTALHCSRLFLAVVLVTVVCCFGFWLVGVLFISFRGLLGSSKSKFFFDLEFDAKDYFKINTSFVCA